MKFTQKLLVTQEVADQLERLCEQPDDSCGRDEVVFDAEVLVDAYRFAIQVVASTEPAKESCWTQGVMFDIDGFEIACTEPGESFLGEYTIDYNENTYEVVVEVKEPE